MGDLSFASFFLGGFECSSHYRSAGERLDLLASIRHAEFAQQDFERLKQQGIRAARTGIRWHLIETRPYQYDFSSVQPILEAAGATRTQLIWDLCHYGWPDDLDIFRPEFVDRFAGLARAFAEFLAAQGETAPLLTPVNEISFFSWAGAEVGYMNPFARHRGSELKAQLVRASVAGMQAIWEVAPQAHMIHVEPLIHVVADPRRPQDIVAATAYDNSQFEAWDMLMGRSFPQLGGQERFAELMGLNFYSDNEWIYHGPKLNRTHPLYRPLHLLLSDVYARYRRPMFISETGTEGRDRPAWLRYVTEEVLHAIRLGIPVVGICLYPIVNHPGWEDDRHCPNGLWDYANDAGEREIYQPLADELHRQQKNVEQALRQLQAQPESGQEPGRQEPVRVQQAPR